MKWTLLFITLSIPSILTAQTTSITLSEDVELIQLNDNLYIHKTFTNSKTYGRFSSNGLIYINNNEVLVADTPTDTIQTAFIIDWLKDQKLAIKAVVVNHHHSDALGGLAVFHKNNIPSYGFHKTTELAHELGLESPIHTFTDSTKLKIGKTDIHLYHFGEGHTIDNALVWIPSEKTFFGGCMIKSIGSGKGNLEDANIKEWPNTISRVKARFTEAQIVIPGHGRHGGIELLDYTINMFAK